MGKVARVQKPQRIQNKGMKIILECHYRTHSDDMLAALKWFSIKERFLYNMCCIMWKIRNGKVPDYLANLTSEAQNVHQYSTRSATGNNLFVANCHNKSLKYHGTRVWNAVSQNLRKTANSKIFKTLLTMHVKNL